MAPLVVGFHYELPNSVHSRSTDGGRVGVTWNYQWNKTDREWQKLSRRFW